jgi:hypothetical protein
MNKEKITVTIGTNGEVEISADGFKGKRCHAETKFLEDALGLNTSKRRNKPEYFASETVKQTQRT